MMWAVAVLVADATISFTGLTALVPGRERSYHAVLVNARTETRYLNHPIPSHVPFVMVEQDVTVGGLPSRGVREVDCTHGAWRCFELTRVSYWIEAGAPDRVKVHRTFLDNVARVSRLHRASGPVNPKHARGKGVASAIHFRNGTLWAPRPHETHCRVYVEDEEGAQPEIAEWVDLRLGPVSEVRFCTEVDSCDGDTLALRLQFRASDEVQIWVKNLPLKTGSAGGVGGSHRHGDPAHFGLFYSLLDGGVKPDEEPRPALPSCTPHTHADSNVELAEAVDVHHAKVRGLDIVALSVDSTICPPSQFP